MSKTLKNQTVEWNKLPWKQIERKVFKLQKRIFRASQRGDVKAVRRLQKTLMRSWSAKCLATRKVTQDNRGKRTAGVDGLKNLSPKQRMSLVSQIKVTGKALPARRVWIDNPGRDEKRPLGIPTMQDRAKQALVKLILEPEWEAKFEPNSYGFRPGRSTHDAIEAIFKHINRKEKYVLDADISQCFDKIDHTALLEKLNTFPTLRHQIKAWLKAGVIDFGVFSKTETGTPQGGVISPLLANIALHGFEEYITSFKKAGRYPNGQANKTSAAVIRYADDFVILHESKEFVEQLQNRAAEWLGGMGLELKASKTKICHTTEGFDFLGFNARQYKVGAYRAAKIGKAGWQEPENLGFKALIKPSKKAIEKHLDEVKKIIKAHHGAPQKALISRLNPIIRGWSNYYSSVSSKETFSDCTSLIFSMLKAWGKRKCSRSNSSEIIQKYWRTIGGDNWAFATEDGHKLIKHQETLIIRHNKIQGTSSPFDGRDSYWSLRTKSYPGLTPRVKKLLERQKGKCEHCGLLFRNEDVMEVDHKIPLSLGGEDRMNNLQLLHAHSHDVKGTHEKRQFIEEPCAGKLASTVLKERVTK